MITTKPPTSLHAGWVWMQRASISFALVIAVGSLVVLVLNGDASGFLAMFSLAVTLFAVWLSIRIFRNQGAQSRDEAEASEKILKQIKASASNAASSAASAASDLSELKPLLIKAQQAKANESLSSERIDDALLAYGAVPKGAHQVLWVDDNASWVSLERAMFESAGVSTVWVPNTARALALMEENSFGVVISDMARTEGRREGYVLLDELRRRGYETPFIVYSSSGRSDHIDEIIEHDGQGGTNDPTELFRLVMRQLS